jgi:hypothetical protein
MTKLTKISIQQMTFSCIMLLVVPLISWCEDKKDCSTSNKDVNKPQPTLQTNMVNGCTFEQIVYSSGCQLLQKINPNINAAVFYSANYGLRSA